MTEQEQQPEMTRNKHGSEHGLGGNDTNRSHAGKGSRKVLWLGTGTLVIVLLAVVIWWKPWEPVREQLSADAVAQSVLNQYPGRSFIQR